MAVNYPCQWLFADNMLLLGGSFLHPLQMHGGREGHVYDIHPLIIQHFLVTPIWLGLCCNASLFNKGFCLFYAPAAHSNNLCADIAMSAAAEQNYERNGRVAAWLLPPARLRAKLAREGSLSQIRHQKLQIMIVNYLQIHQSREVVKADLPKGAVETLIPLTTFLAITAAPSIPTPNSLSDCSSPMLATRCSPTSGDLLPPFAVQTLGKRGTAAVQSSQAPSLELPWASVLEAHATRAFGSERKHLQTSAGLGSGWAWAGPARTS